MLFCVGPGGSLVDIATQAGRDAFVIAFLIRVPCRHNPAVHFCQLQVRNNPCWMFRRHAKCKWKPRVDLTVASHLEFVMVAYGQEPTDCWGFDTVCAARVDALLRHFDLNDNKDFMRDVALQNWLGLEGVNRHCLGGWLLPGGCAGRRKKKGKRKADLLLIYPCGVLP